MSVIEDEKDLTLTPDSVVSALVDDTTGLSEELKAKGLRFFVSFF